MVGQNDGWKLPRHVFTEDACQLHVFASMIHAQQVSLLFGSSFVWAQIDLCDHAACFTNYVNPKPGGAGKRFVLRDTVTD